MGITFEIPKHVEVGLISLDNKDLSQIATILKRVGLNKVTTFDSLDSSVDFIKSKPSALLIVDVRSRLETGLELLKDIKVDNETINFPIIPVVKAGEHLALLPTLRDYGVQEVVTMPLQATNLLQSITRTLACFLPGELESDIRAARAALAKGRIDDATLILQRLSEKRRTIRTELGLSHVSLARNDLDQSMTFLSRAKGLEPNSFGVHLAFLKHHLHEKMPLGILEDAVASAVPHLRTPGRVSQILKAFYKAEAFTEGFSITVAFEQECSCDPMFKLWQAKFALKCHRLDAALQLLQKFHGTGQRTFESLNMLGIICKKKQSFPMAIQAFLEAQQISPQDYRIPFNLGMTYEDMGDLRKAIACYERALELKPGFPKASARLTQLRLKSAG